MSYQLIRLALLSISALFITSCTESGSLTALSIPAPPSLSLFNINSGDNYTRSNTINLTILAKNAAEMYITENNNCSSGGAWIKYSSTVSNYSISTPDQEKVIYIKVRNPKGEESSCHSDSIILDSTPPLAPESVNLQNPVSSPGNITTPIITVGNNLEVGSVVKIFSESTCSIEIGSVTATASAMNIISNSLSAGDYFIYSQQIDRAGNTSNCSTANTHYTLDLNTPVTPLTLSLLTPSTSPGNNATPVIRVEGVTAGYTIKIYSNDASCGLVNEVASGVVASGQTRIDLQTTSLLEGSHGFYAKTISPGGNSSICSTATVSYQLDLTPPTTPTGLILGSTTAMTSETPIMSWNASLDASGIARYEIQIYTSGDQPIGAPTSKVNGSKKTGLNLTDTTQYYFKVRAIDIASNVSTYSSASALWTAYIGSDTCDGSPTIGTLCSDGTYYIGTITIGGSTYKLATTPGGCTYEPGGNATTAPTSYFTTVCNNTDDSMTKEAKIITTPVTGSDQTDHSFLSPSTVTGFVSSNAVFDAYPSTPAFAYCKYLNYGGSTDWFLPNRSELHMMACHSTLSTSKLLGSNDDINCLINGYASSLNFVPNFLAGENHSSGYAVYHSSSTHSWAGGTNIMEQTVNGPQSGNHTSINEYELGLVRCVRVIP